jgi:dihydroorotate dehydrogenase (fumarate)
LEAAGASAVVLPSIFEEQITLESNALDSDLSRGTDSFAESLSFFPAYDSFRQGQDSYLELIRNAKKVAGIPVLGSLNGATAGGWVSFAKEIEESGADALELNTYSLPTQPSLTSSVIEDGIVELVRQVKTSVKIPVAVKLTSQFTSLPNLAAKLDRVGADGIILFNRFYQPEFDVNNLTVTPKLSLSRSEELLLRLHWTAILYGTVKAQIGVTGGVHTVEDVLKSIMAGGQVAMLASSLLINGIPHITKLQSGLVAWMEEHEYTSVWQMRGSLSRQSVPNPATFERGNYIKTLSSYTLR